MSLIHRVSEPVRTPVRRFTTHYAVFFEDLIHAVKSEIVGKLDRVDRRLEDGERASTSAFESISDQLAVQTANVRALGDEVKRLQAIVEAMADGSIMLAPSPTPDRRQPVADGADGPARSNGG